MAASNVLIVGVQGLGVEIGRILSYILLSRIKVLLAKNITLAGVKSVTIFDPDPVTVQDLSSQVSDIVIRPTDPFQNLCLVLPPSRRHRKTACRSYTSKIGRTERICPRS
jgi:hypothetical protein